MLIVFWCTKCRLSLVEGNIVSENSYKNFSENLCNSITYPNGNDITNRGDLYPVVWL